MEDVHRMDAGLQQMLVSRRALVLASRRRWRWRPCFFFLFFSFNDRTLLVLVEIREDSPSVLIPIRIRVSRGGALPLPVATDGGKSSVFSVHSLPPNSPLGSLGDR